MDDIRLVTAPAMTQAAEGAQAELLLVADNGFQTVSTRMIHRFDAKTGAYLGSFGSFLTSITGTWLSKSTKSLFVVDGGGTSEWDYETGALKNTYPSWSMGCRFSVRPDGKRKAIFDGGPDFCLGQFCGEAPDAVGGSCPEASYKSGIWYSHNELLAYDQAGNRFIKAVLNDEGTCGETSGASGSNGNAAHGQMAQRGGTSDFVMACGDNIKVVNSITLALTSFGFMAGTANSAAPAQNGFFIGSTKAGMGTITYYDRCSVLRGRFSHATLHDPAFMETVLEGDAVSEEPESAAAADVLRRRGVI